MPESPDARTQGRPVAGLRGHPELSSFSREYTEYAGWRGSRAGVRFSYVGRQNQHFQSTLLGGREGVTKKSTLCTLLIMLIIMDDP